MEERIYCHLQTDCFVLSELFSVDRHIEAGIETHPTLRETKSQTALRVCVCVCVCVGVMSRKIYIWKMKKNDKQIGILLYTVYILVNEFKPELCFSFGRKLLEMSPPLYSQLWF